MITPYLTTPSLGPECTKFHRAHRRGSYLAVNKTCVFGGYLPSNGTCWPKGVAEVDLGTLDPQPPVPPPDLPSICAAIRGTARSTPRRLYDGTFMFQEDAVLAVRLREL